MLGATKANAFNNMIPGITAIMMWIIYGEVLRVIKIVGIAIVVIGMFISQTMITRWRPVVTLKRFMSRGSGGKLSA